MKKFALIFLAPLAFFAFSSSAFATTVDFSPSLDGTLESVGAGGVWSVAHGGTVIDYNDTAGTTLYDGAFFDSGNWYLRHAYLYFDTSTLPDDAVIDSASISIVDKDEIDDSGDANSYYAFTLATPASSTSLANADFTECDTTELSDEVTSTTLSSNINSYTAFNLNSAGKSGLNLTGKTLYCLLEGHDIHNVEPPGTVRGLIASAETTGTSSDPVLEVVYHLSGGSSSSSSSSVSSSSSSSISPCGGSGCTIDSSGSLIIMDHYCNDYIPAVYSGSGVLIAQAVCDQWSTTIKIPAVKYFDSVWRNIAFDSAKLIIWLAAVWFIAYKIIKKAWETIRWRPGKNDARRPRRGNIFHISNV